MDTSTQALKVALFKEIARLSDPDLKGKELGEEVERCRAINGAAATIVQCTRVTHDVVRLAYDMGDDAAARRLMGLPAATGR